MYGVIISIGYGVVGLEGFLIACIGEVFRIFSSFHNSGQQCFGTVVNLGFSFGQKTFMQLVIVINYTASLSSYCVIGVVWVFFQVHYSALYRVDQLNHLFSQFSFIGLVSTQFTSHCKSLWFMFQVFGVLVLMALLECLLLVLNTCQALSHVWYGLVKVCIYSLV